MFTLKHLKTLQHGKVIWMNQLDATMIY